MGGMGGMGWMWLWWVLIVLGIVAMAAALLWATAGRGGTGRTTDEPSSARRILDERYARGEIDEGEYRKRRRDIEGA